jgi:hypothetical protein
MDKLEQLDKLKKRNLAILKAIIDNDLDACKAEVERINKYFASTLPSKIFDVNDSKSVLVEMDNAFEDVCFVLESHGIQRPKELSIYEFQRKLELIKQKTKQKKSHDGSGKIAVQ